jgi:hypothetical protein
MIQKVVRPVLLSHHTPRVDRHTVRLNHVQAVGLCFIFQIDKVNKVPDFDLHFFSHSIDSTGPSSNAKTVHPVIYNTVIGKMSVYLLFCMGVKLSLTPKRRTQLEGVRPYSHGTTQKKLKGYASHQTVAWETPPNHRDGSPPVAPSEKRH